MKQEHIERLAALWGVEVARVAGQEVWMPCPFAPYGGHEGAQSGGTSFSVRAEPNGTSPAKCFACGRGGSLRRLAWQLAQLDPGMAQAFRFVKKHDVGAFDPTQFGKEEEPEEKEDDASLQRVLRMAGNRVSDELRARGVTPADEKKWRLGHDGLDERDVFPVFDENRKLVGIQGRRLDDNEVVKYTTYGADPEALMGFFYGEQFIDPTVPEGILVEGPLDAIKAGRYFPNVLGLLGAGTMTPERTQRLKRWFETLTFLYDADAPAVAAMFKVGLLLVKHFTLFVAFLPEGSDPFDASPETLKAAMEGRVLWSLVDWGAVGGALPAQA